MAAKVTTVTVVPIKFSTIPAGRRGFRASGPMIGIRENGQIAFNSTLTKELGITADTKVYVGFGTDRKLHFIVTEKPLTKDTTAADLATLNYSEKNKSCYMSGTGFLGNLGYDYKASGSQSFNGDSLIVEPNYKAGAHVSLLLPEGALTPKPKTERKPRAKKDAGAAVAAVAAVGGPATAPVAEQSEELTFDA
jgi:hypothetical protein